MIGMPHGARIWLACGATAMRRGFDGLAALVQTQLAADPLRRSSFRVPRPARQSLEDSGASCCRNLSNPCECCAAAETSLVLTEKDGTP
jgi:transposase